MKRKLKCKVCNASFAPKKEELYLVVERVGGLALLAGTNPRTLECFDCPSCGCQNMVNIRATPMDDKEPDEEDTDEEAAGDG